MPAARGFRFGISKFALAGGGGDGLSKFARYLIDNQRMHMLSALRREIKVKVVGMPGRFQFGNVAPHSRKGREKDRAPAVVSPAFVCAESIG